MKRIEDFPGVVILAESREHLKEHKLTYFQHMKVAAWFAWTFTKVALAAVCHGIFPSLFKTYASDKIKEVYNKITFNT